MNNNKGWKYAFRNKEEFEFYCNLLTLHFEHKQPDLPLESIKIKSNTKTTVAKILRSIHKELGEKLAGDEDFFKIIKVLSPFKNMSSDEVYRALTR